MLCVNGTEYNLLWGFDLIQLREQVKWFVQDAPSMSSVEPEVTVSQLDQQLGREAGALQLRTQLKEDI